MSKKTTLFLLFSLLFLNSYAARFETISVKSELMKRTLRCTVVIPKGYKADISYNQLYLLHGTDGDYRSWKEICDLSKRADQLQRLIICPSTNKNSWYTESDHSESFLITELIPFIDNKYNTQDDRWITGIANGGYASLKLGFKYPKIFSAVGSISAIIKPSLWENKYDIAKTFGQDVKSGAYDAFETEEELEAVEFNQRPFSILCPLDDTFYVENRDIFTMIKHMGINVFWIKKLEGSHNKISWRKCFDEQMKYFTNETSKK